MQDHVKVETPKNSSFGFIINSRGWISTRDNEEQCITKSEG